MEGTPKSSDYEIIEINIPGQERTERVKIPASPKFGEELKRLSRKAQRGQPYVNRTWSENYGAFLRWKEKSLTLGSITYGIREAHFEDEPPESSLVEIQVLTSFPSGQMGETPTFSTQYLTYYPDLDRIDVMIFDRLTDDDTDESAQEAAELRAQVDPLESQPKHRAFMYTTLVWLAGEKLPK